MRLSFVGLIALPIACASSEAPPQSADAAAAPAEIEIAPVKAVTVATATAPQLSAAAPVAPEPTLCDQYWVRMRSCMEISLKDADPSARVAAMKALDDAEKSTREAFAKMEAGSLDTACRAMIDAMQQNPMCAEPSP